MLCIEEQEMPINGKPANGHWRNLANWTSNFHLFLLVTPPKCLGEPFIRSFKIGNTAANLTHFRCGDYDMEFFLYPS